MKAKRILQLASVVLLGSMTQNMFAQEDLLSGKPIYPLGEPKTWTNGEETVTFDSSALDKLVATPTNTDNVYLYPENPSSNNEANIEIGAQTFYIDMGSVKSVGSVFTTWEGAAANDYNIYLTDSEPTLDILSTEPTYSVTNLGQYTANTAILPDGSKGQYLVFEVTRATNWGWGVKIRSISASAPMDAILTTFTVAPSIVMLNMETPLTLTLQDQLGVDLSVEDVEITISDNATYIDGNIIITSGSKATFTAKMNDVELTADVYVATAPTPPAATSIKTPIYTNTVQDKNSTVEFTVAYNGGAKDMGEILFDNGLVAKSFMNTRCVFFSNSETTGAWNGNIDPATNGYRSLNLDVFSAKDVDCTIEFESVENLEGGHTYPFSLNAGEWNSLTVDVNGATKLGNLSIRFTEENMDDILLANIYFSPTYIEGDEEAPVMGEVSYTSTMDSVELTMSATDDLSADVYFSITDGVNTYSTSAPSGQEVSYTVSDLLPGTTYVFTITANDGKNTSEEKTVEAKTKGLTVSPDPSDKIGETDVVVFSSYNKAELPAFDAEGSTAEMGLMELENETSVLFFYNFMNQSGKLDNLNVDITETNSLYINIYSFDEEGTLTIAPVWKNADSSEASLEVLADTPDQIVELTANEWNSITIPLRDFGYPTYGSIISQIEFSASTVSKFAIDNLYFYNDSTLAIGEIVTDEKSNIVDVYNLQGVRVRSGVEKSSALQDLPAGIYIVGDKKVVK